MPLLYKPGSAVLASGVYLVKHDPPHRADHEVTVVKGESFPPCNECGPGVRFAAVRVAHYVRNHEAFYQWSYKWRG
jgi:hypothetical protein